MAEAKTPQGFFSRIKSAARYVISGADDAWFGPNQPQQPAAQQAKGRQFDYPTGSNLQLSPRSGEAVSFPQMRSLANNYDLLRLVIETRKDQLAKIPWDVRYRDQSKDSDSNDPMIAEVQNFLMYPDKVRSFHNWFRMLLEDMLVIDAATIYPRLTRGGDVYSFEIVDGSTIKPVITSDGRRPFPPDPAFQQVLKGIPAVDYTNDELIYYPRNERSNHLYGFSPVEQIIMTVNIALRRQLHQLQFYTEGNVPEALIGVPDTWTTDQIKQWQDYWDALMEGNTAHRRHAKFVPGNMTYQATKAEAIGDEFDEWLARVICYAFSVPPTPFVKQVNRAVSQTLHMAAIQEGLIPLQMWSKNLMDLLIQKYLGHPELEFFWTDTEEEDPLQIAQVNDIKVRNGTKTINEAREEDGLDPIEGGDEHLIYTSQGAVKLADVLNPPKPIVVAPTPPESLPNAKSPTSPGAKHPLATPAVKLDLKKKSLHRDSRTIPHQSNGYGSTSKHIL